MDSPVKYTNFWSNIFLNDTWMKLLYTLLHYAELHLKKLGNFNKHTHYTKTFLPLGWLVVYSASKILLSLLLWVVVGSDLLPLCCVYVFTALKVCWDSWWSNKSPWHLNISNMWYYRTIIKIPVLPMFWGSSTFRIVQASTCS